MESENETIRAALTESQRSLLVKMVQSGLRSGDLKDEDVAVYLRYDLFEYPEAQHHKEDYSGKRESTVIPTLPVPSQFGREWVAWYLAKRR
jgi:hypothetical protein